MTKTVTLDPGRIRELISQNFGNAQTPGRLGEHSAQIGPAQPPRAQPSESGFANKAKNLLDRAVTFIRSNSEQRAEQGIARGVQNFDKALGKLLDAMKPDDKGDIDFAKLSRRLDALPGSAKAATSRGADYKELFKARLDLLVAGEPDHELEGLSKANLELMSSFNNKCERLGITLYSGPERLREAAHINAWHLKVMDKALGDETSKRQARPDYGLFP